MLLGIDHLVIAVRDPEAAAAELAEHLGLESGGGGTHDAAPRTSAGTRLLGCDWEVG